jgi:hypothetical protein
MRPDLIRQETRLGLLSVPDPVELDIDIGSGVAGRRLQRHRAFKQEQ